MRVWGPIKLQPLTTAKKFSYTEVRLMKKYLPSFVYPEKSTEEHRQIAATHWEQTFKETPAKHVRTSVDNYVSQREAKHITKAQSSKITELYDVFYAYLEEHGGDLKHVFRSSMHVRGRVLVHISAGMRTMLASENIAEKVLTLTKTHRRFGVKLEHFDCVGRALLHAMEQTSGENWSPAIADAWSRMFSHSSVILIRSQRKLERKEHRTTTAAAKTSGPLILDPVGPDTNLVVAKPSRLSLHNIFPSFLSRRSVADDSRGSQTTTARSGISGASERG